MAKAKKTKKVRNNSGNSSRTFDYTCTKVDFWEADGKYHFFCTSKGDNDNYIRCFLDKSSVTHNSSKKIWVENFSRGMSDFFCVCNLYPYLQKLPQMTQLYLYAFVGSYHNMLLLDNEPLEVADEWLEGICKSHEGADFIPYLRQFKKIFSVTEDRVNISVLNFDDISKSVLATASSIIVN